MKIKTIAVLSGGMDSTTALAFIKNQPGMEIVGAISFNYGSKHNDREWESAKAVAEHYSIPIVRCDLDFVSKNFSSDLLKSGGDIPEGHYADPSMKRTVVPFRNGIMLSIAGGYAESKGAGAILLGNHFGDHAIYPDCREEFVNAMSNALILGTYAQIKLLTPFTQISKTEIVLTGDSLKVPYEKTYSCYKGEKDHCGKCGTCFERKEAFKDAGVSDPTTYVD